METTAAPPPPIARPAAPPAPVGLVALNWFLPGAGFCLAGRWKRGLIQAGLVLLTTALGWGLHGAVIWPSWSPKDVDFNLINNLTLIVQLGAGVPAMLSLLAHELGWTVIGGVEKAAYFELGSYYIVMAGAINYFATRNFYDRLVRREARYQEQEAETGKDLI